MSERSAELAQAVDRVQVAVCDIVEGHDGERVGKYPKFNAALADALRLSAAEGAEEALHRLDTPPAHSWTLTCQRKDAEAELAAARAAIGLEVAAMVWEHEQDKDLRPQCPKCGAEPFARGCCSSCCHGARYGPVAKKRKRR